MANPLYNVFNPMNDLVRQVKEMKKTFRGNPREEVEKLLNSGAMTQEQFNHYTQIAQQVMQTMNIN